MTHPIVEKILFAGAMAVLCLHFAVCDLADRRAAPAAQSAPFYEND